jgi:hypothetical protein
MRYTQKHPQHTYTKRDIYYFSRVILSDLKHHYIKPRIIQSLKTKSEHRASTASVVKGGCVLDEGGKAYAKTLDAFVKSASLRHPSNLELQRG